MAEVTTDRQATGEPVTVLLTRRVRPGSEEAFESVVQRLATAAERRPGFAGVTMLRPELGGRAEYAIVVRFQSAAQLTTWLDSAERAALLAEADRYADAELGVHSAAGVAGWFTLPGTHLVKAPSKMKMAIASWLGILPLLLPLNLYLAPHLTAIPAVPRVLAAGLAMSFAMTYLIMPALTRLLRAWLWPSRRA
jgi:uncharacterized protein